MNYDHRNHISMSYGLCNAIFLDVPIYPRVSYIYTLPNTQSTSVIPVILCTTIPLLTIPANVSCGDTIWIFPPPCVHSTATCTVYPLYWSHISKKHFRPVGMAPSEWTRSVRAVRDTPVADYSAAGVNTTRRVAYRPPITVSQFLLALSVSYFKQTLWRCGQL